MILCVNETTEENVDAVFLIVDIWIKWKITKIRKLQENTSTIWFHRLELFWIKIQSALNDNIYMTIFLPKANTPVVNDLNIHH